MLDLLHAWILFPAALALVVFGLGLLAERLSGEPVPGLLLGPLGLAALIAVGAATTLIPAVAPFSPHVAAVLAVIGLAVGHRRRAPRLGPALAVLVVFLAYGAPVILSGQATFAGYLRLDDTATWLAFSDQVLANGRVYEDLPASSFRQLLEANLSQGYPLGAYPPLAVGGALSGLDLAWAFAPYLAFCGALIAAGLFVLLEPLPISPRLRAIAAGAAAQPALLYGYVQWGGIKEITVASLLVLLVALAAERAQRGPGTARSTVPFAVASAAMVAVVGPGGGAVVAPLFVVLAVVWARAARARGERGLRSARMPLAVLAGMIVAWSLPTLIALAGDLAFGKAFFESSADQATRLGNLAGPVSGFQLGGIWFARDFRSSPELWPTALLLGVVGAAAAGGLWAAMRAKAFGVAMLVGIALLTVLGSAVSGASPWLMGKALAIASPALPFAALCGAAVLAAHRRVPGVIAFAAIVAGIAGSNVLAYTNVTLAPRERLAELERVADVIKGHGPTFDNEYEVYATRHFLRDAATVQPAEVRGAALPLIDGRFLVQAASADIDAFPPETLAPYRSVVVSRAPTVSRPSSEFERVWQGKRYAVYRRTGIGTLVRHVPLGDSRSLPYCGNAQNAGPLPLCAVQPVATPTCRVIERLGRQAAAVGASLVAAVRPAPIVLRGDDVRWPASWYHDPAGHTLTPTQFGTATARLEVPAAGSYELWLGGTFARGFTVRVDGKVLGRVRHELGSIGASTPVGELSLSRGAHTIQLTYPTAGYGPGEADASRLTMVASIALRPAASDAQLLAVPAAAARTLCGRSFDWIDLVR